MAVTTHTWYSGPDASLLSVYDPDDKANTARLLQDENALSAWWVDATGNQFLVWKKPQEEVPEYLFYGGFSPWELQTFNPE